MKNPGRDGDRGRFSERLDSSSARCRPPLHLALGNIRLGKQEGVALAALCGIQIMLRDCVVLSARADDGDDHDGFSSELGLPVGSKLRRTQPLANIG